MKYETLRGAFERKRLGMGWLTGEAANVEKKLTEEFDDCADRTIDLRETFNNFFSVLSGKNPDELIAVELGDPSKNGPRFWIEVARRGHAVGYACVEGEKPQRMETVLVLLGGVGVRHSGLTFNVSEDGGWWLSYEPRGLDSEDNGRSVGEKAGLLSGVKKWMESAEETMSTLWIAAHNPDLNPTLAEKLLAHQGVYGSPPSYY